jgi:hypothetical protein
MVRLSDVIDVGFKQDVDEVPVITELTGNPAIRWVVVEGHDLSSNVRDGTAMPTAWASHWHHIWDVLSTVTVDRYRA